MSAPRPFARVDGADPDRVSPWPSVGRSGSSQARRRRSPRTCVPLPGPVPRRCNSPRLAAWMGSRGRSSGPSSRRRLPSSPIRWFAGLDPITGQWRLSSRRDGGSARLQPRAAERNRVLPGASVFTRLAKPITWNPIHLVSRLDRPTGCKRGFSLWRVLGGPHSDADIRRVAGHRVPPPNRPSLHRLHGVDSCRGGTPHGAPRVKQGAYSSLTDAPNRETRSVHTEEQSNTPVSSPPVIVKNSVLNIEDVFSGNLRGSTRSIR